MVFYFFLSFFFTHGVGSELGSELEVKKAPAQLSNRAYWALRIERILDLNELVILIIDVGMCFTII